MISVNRITSHTREAEGKEEEKGREDHVENT
jgi:hypothetical protein